MRIHQKEQAYYYFAEKNERIQNYTVDNIKCAKELQKKHYDKRSRSHTFAVGDKIYLEIQRRTLNEENKLRNQYCGPYFIEKIHISYKRYLTE